MKTYINNKITTLVLAAAFTVLPGTATAAVCFLADEDLESCARVDAIGQISEIDSGRYTSVIMEGIDPSNWENGATLDDDGSPIVDPDWVEFNIIFDQGASIAADNVVRFVDRFKMKGVESGQVHVSLWLTDENHQIIDDLGWDPSSVATVVVDYDGDGNGVMTATDSDGFKSFNLVGAARFNSQVQWWDYHLAFDFRDAVMAADAAIELLAPTTYRVCDGANYADGPCAFGKDIGMVVVAEPTGMIFFGGALMSVFLLMRRRRILL